MERNGHAAQSRVEKEQPDNTDERFAVFVIDFSSRRDKRFEKPWFNHEIQHAEISPLRGQERLHATNVAASKAFEVANFRGPAARPAVAPYLVQEFFERRIALGAER